MTGDLPPGNLSSATDGPGQPDQETYAGTPPVLDQLFDADSLYALRAAVEAHASEAGMREGRCGDLVVAVHELAANAVRHGAGAGRLRMWNRAGVLHGQVTDDGTPRSAQHGEEADRGSGPAAQDLAAAWPYEHGHGLWMVRQLADQFRLRSDSHGTVAAVTFVLPSSRPSFRLTQHARDGYTVLELAGDLDQGSAAELTAVIGALIAASPALRLILDLDALALWDSAGIVALITAQRLVSGSPAATMILTGLSDRFRQRLHAIDVTSQFTLADSAGDAPGRIGPSD